MTTFSRRFPFRKNDILVVSSPQTKNKERKSKIESKRYRDNEKLKNRKQKIVFSFFLVFLL